ncbi:hypothetical protein A8A01_10230 [Ewingella americana]|nr:hypothetical protein A8A01_10230 [Ewingella americana]
MLRPGGGERRVTGIQCFHHPEFWQGLDGSREARTPWMETARLKGLPPLRILWRHAAPNAISPVLTVIAMNLAGLIVGAMIIEVIFVYPGVGQYMVDAVTVRDIPVVQACGLVFAAVYILLNLLVDMLAMAANPRLRFPR